MSEERDEVRPNYVQYSSTLQCDENVAGQGHQVPKYVGRTDRPALSSLAEQPYLTDGFLDHEIFLQLRIPMRNWSSRLSAAMELAPSEAELQYLVWGGKAWHAMYRKDDFLYTGTAYSMCRAIIAAAMRVLENAPNTSRTSGHWKDD